MTTEGIKVMQLNIVGAFLDDWFSFRCPTKYLSGITTFSLPSILENLKTFALFFEKALSRQNIQFNTKTNEEVHCSPFSS